MSDAMLDPNVIDTLRGLPSPDERGMLACIAELFTRDSAALVGQIVQAGAAGDWPALSAAAHALKSYAGNVGAAALAGQLRDLERAAKAGDASACLALVAAVPAACAAVDAALLAEVQRK